MIQNNASIDAIKLTKDFMTVFENFQKIYGNYKKVILMKR